MRLHIWKDILLNTLLAILVVTSILLSAKAWYPDKTPAQFLTPSIQPQPPATERQMPDILRPEMLLLRKPGNAVAPVHTGSLAYTRIWPQLRVVLESIEGSGGAFTVDRVPERLEEAEWIELKLPTAIMLSEWANHWQWNNPDLRNGSMRIDRLTFYLGQPGAIYLTGPVGLTLYLDDLTEEHRHTLLLAMESLDPTLFVQHRPVDTTDLPARLNHNLLVSTLDRMPIAHLRVVPPSEHDEEVRYFPDLSVVRQIDDQEARSLTDGQRLLRFTNTGLLEYRTADPSNRSNSPDLDRALDLAREWVAARGGWPQEIVLRRYTQQPGRAKLEFDYRSGGPFPVESAGPAVQVHVSAQRVVFFSRYPTFVETRFQREQQSIITPETALRRAVDQFPLLLIEPVRSMHLAYVAQPNPEPDEGASMWVLEPAWVIQAAESRIYVSAGAGPRRTPVHVVR